MAYAGQNIIVITSSDLPAYRRAGVVLGRQMEESGLSSSYTTVFWSLDTAKAKGATTQSATAKSVTTAVTSEQGSIIVTIGSAAADYAVHHFADSSIICSFITRNAFESIGADTSPNNAVTAVFIDQPISRLINMSTLLRKNQSPYKIGFLGQSILPVQSVVSGAGGKTNDIEIDSTVLVLDENPIKQIEPLMKNSDVFIIRPNTSLFNRLVARLVLQLSMRYKTPVIGFSENYAKAGALLSLYASPEDIGLDAGNMLSEWLRAPLKLMPASRDGKEFSLVINRRIARKLGLSLEIEKLKSRLQIMEGK